ncbi:MAG: hypothetical protein ACOC3V_02275 [bacterium]
MKIEGYLPTGIVRDVTYYFSKTKEKFVDSVEKIYLGDLFLDRESAEKYVDIKDYPLVDKYGGVAKVSLEISI